MTLTFNNEVTISDILTFASLVLVVIGGFFAYWQWRKSVSLKRADYINDLTENLRTDKAISKAIYLFDYDDIWYTEEFHGNTDLELAIDKTLSYFSYICYLKKQKIISENEFLFFKYEIERILTNSQTKNYLYNLYHFSKECKVPMTFKYLFDYGESQGMFATSFYDDKSELYPHYLNF